MRTIEQINSEIMKEMFSVLVVAVMISSLLFARVFPIGWVAVLILSAMILGHIYAIERRQKIIKNGFHSKAQGV